MNSIAFLLSAVLAVTIVEAGVIRHNNVEYEFYPVVRVLDSHEVPDGDVIDSGVVSYGDYNGHSGDPFVDDEVLDLLMDKERISHAKTHSHHLPSLCSKSHADKETLYHGPAKMVFSKKELAEEMKGKKLLYRGYIPIRLPNCKQV